MGVSGVFGLLGCSGCVPGCSVPFTVPDFTDTSLRVCKGVVWLIKPVDSRCGLKLPKIIFLLI